MLWREKRYLYDLNEFDTEFIFLEIISALPKNKMSLVALKIIPFHHGKYFCGANVGQVDRAQLKFANGRDWWVM